MSSAPTTPAVLAARPILLPDWREREAAHTARAAALTAARRYRAERRLTDPVEDFLWDYYSLKPRHLARWHPGAGYALPDDGHLAWRATARWVRRLGPDDAAHPSPNGTSRPAPDDATHPSPNATSRPTPPDDAAHPTPDGTARGGPARAPSSAITLDTDAFLRDRGEDVARLRFLLEATARRTARFACFGWHEWAMVYRQEEHRHPLPLRLGQEGTDAAVESADLRCTHYDAFRFYTPAARPRNERELTRETQPQFEQPGCLHANMDLLKAALLLGPACPGELLLDAFELARRIRTLDMAASPYDCSSLGLEPVRVESAAGRAEYVARQREFAEESAGIRRRLLAVTERVVA